MAILQKSRIRYHCLALVQILMVIFLTSCKKNKDLIKESSFQKNQILAKLDSLYLIAEQVYLWNDKLPEKVSFNPNSYYRDQSDELEMYSNELFAITRFAKHKETSTPIEFNLYYPNLPKYSTIIPRYLSVDDRSNEYSINNPFGISISIDGSSIKILYVDSNSPAGKAGIKRGFEIFSINDQLVNSERSFLENWATAQRISFLKLGVLDSDKKKREIRLNASVYDSNPIIKHNVISLSGKKIGYFAYNSFATEQKSIKYLEPIFSTFMQNEISELIIDLRYNQGGYQSSVNYLANLIVPITADSKLMYSEHYNKLMQQGNASILKHQILLDSDGQPLYFNGKKASLFDLDFTLAANTYYFNKKAGPLDLKKVYFIVSDKTASASELLINVLEPYIEIKVIGVSAENKDNVRTYGKPVGFFDLAVGRFDLYLSMYQLKNGNGIGDYFDGLEADYSTIDDARYDFGTIADPAIAIILDNNPKLKLTNRHQEFSNNRSKHYFNNDRLKGNIKETNSFKFKKSK